MEHRCPSVRIVIIFPFISHHLFSVALLGSSQSRNWSAWQRGRKVAVDTSWAACTTVIRRATRIGTVASCTREPARAWEPDWTGLRYWECRRWTTSSDFPGHRYPRERRKSIGSRRAATQPATASSARWRDRGRWHWPKVRINQHNVSYKLRRLIQCSSARAPIFCINFCDWFTERCNWH